MSPMIPYYLRLITTKKDEINDFNLLKISSWDKNEYKLSKIQDLGF